jgi:hypothetical protein
MAHFIAVYTNAEGGQSPKLVKEQYDYEIKLEDKDILSSYLSKNIENQNIENQNIVIISENTELSKSIIPIYSQSHEKLITLYISNNPNILYQKNIIYIGLDKNLIEDNTEEELNKLDNPFVPYITIQKIIKLCQTNKLDSIVKYINNICIDNIVNVIIDLQIIDINNCPSVKRDSNQTKYISLDTIYKLLNKNINIKYLNILGFDSSIDNPTNKLTKLTGNSCRNIIKYIFDITEKSINIFTEDTRFLIYRPIEQLLINTDTNDNSEPENEPDSEPEHNPETDDISTYIDTTKQTDDYGWYILRFMTLREREDIIKHLIDRVITISVKLDDTDEETEIYITTTTINEQNNKSFYLANKIEDYCLFPKEKLAMMFELVNI